jgi:putative ABC transport system substrate-binding protein
MLNRRKLLVVLGASALISPLAAFAQQTGKIWRVGFLSQRRIDTLDIDPYGGFLNGMRELGYVEGRDLVMEWRSAGSKSERLSELASELVKLKVDVIVAAGSQSISAAQKATTSIPIVMGTTTADPVSAGFVASLARPGGNITGLALVLEDISPKHLELLIRVAPKLSRVAVLANPDSPEVVVPKKLESAAQKAGVTVLTVEARNLQEIERAFLVMKKEKAQAFIFISTSVFMQHRHRIVELAAQNRQPFVSNYHEYVEAGGLMSYGPSLADNYRRAATYVDKIFKGANPGDLPVEQPAKFELLINRKTANALGLTIPRSLLASADKVLG